MSLIGNLERLRVVFCVMNNKMVSAEIEDQKIAALMEWYNAMGIDALLDEEAVNFTLITEALPTAKTKFSNNTAANAIESKNTKTKSSKSIHTPNTIHLSYEECKILAEQCKDLESLRQAVENYQGCELKTLAQNTVFGDGNANAKIMFIGEAPGRDEDKAGIPFVGRAGHLLDKALNAIGLTRENYYITNAVYWRPPGNRTPTPAETLSCAAFSQRQIELVDPDIIVALGATAAREIFKRNDGILKLRGKFENKIFLGRERQLFATLHPAYLLRQPLQKRLVWQDMLTIQEKLNHHS